MPYPINNKCNFNCSFCDRQWVDPSTISDEDILRDAPISELSGLRAVLGGGEPTLHPKLPQILEGLKRQKVRKIAIRTNAAWASKANLIPILKKKGLSDAVVLFPTLDEQLFDQLVGKKEAYQAVIAGIRNLQEARIDITLRIPILKPTLNDLPALLDALPHVIGKIKRIDLVYLDMNKPELQVPLDAINKIFPFGSQHPNPNLPPIYLDPGSGIPMCWIEKMKQWNITPDCPTSEGKQTDICRTCFVKQGCSGIPKGHLETFGDAGFTPFRSPIVESYENKPHIEIKGSEDANLEKKQGLTYECLDGEQTTLASMRLRVGHECNRRCEFCFIPHHEKSVQDYNIERSIESAVAMGVRELVMTGGEPTLQKDLPVYIQQANDLGVRRIILQTNGIRLANPEYCQKLVDAGLTTVIISLHSHLENVLSEITKVPKALDRILQGIANLHAAGVQISLTHVIGPKNYHLLPAYARFMVEKAKINRFCFIFATPMAWQMAKESIVVRYSDAAPYLMEAMDYCIEKGALVDGLAFKCGAPHCIVKGEPKYLVDAEIIPDNNRSEDWVRVPACKTCILKKQCYGVRRLYVWLYGVDEFRPILDSKKSVEHWSPREDLSPSKEGIFPHKITPKQYPRELLLEQLQHFARTQKIPTSAMNNFLNQYQQFPIKDLQDNSGFHFEHNYPHSIPVNIGPISTEGSPAEAKQQALLRSLRSLAFNIPIRGAHGFLPSPQFDALDYVSQLPKEHVSLITPHTRFSPPEIALPHVKTLRSNAFCSAHNASMTSVNSVLSLAKIALEHLNLDQKDLRYSVWGYGRAGQFFARKFDLVSVSNRQSQLIRPKLIGCADSKSSWIDPNGLDHERILSFKLRNGKLPSGSQDTPDQVLWTPTDLLLLSGKGSPINMSNIDRLQTKILIDMTGSLGADIEDELQKRGILYIPSVIATSGPFLLSILELASKAPELFLENNIELPKMTEDSFRQNFQQYLDQELQSLFQQLLKISERQSINFLESFLFLALQNWYALKVSVENHEISQLVQ